MQSKWMKLSERTERGSLVSSERVARRHVSRYPFGSSHVPPVLVELGKLADNLVDATLGEARCHSHVTPTQGVARGPGQHQLVAV